MKCGASQNRDATASSDLWKSLKFSAAFLAASVFPEQTENHPSPSSESPCGIAATASLDAARVEVNLFDSLTLPASQNSQTLRAATLSPEDKVKYESLLRKFDQLKELPLPSFFTPVTVYLPGSPDANTHQHIRDMAALYVELLNAHRGLVGKNTPSFPFLGKMTSWLREGAVVLGDVNSPAAEVRAAGERMWEYELSEAVARNGAGLSAPSVMDRLQANRGAWGERNPLGSPIPDLVDAGAIPSSWTLSQRSLVALGTTSWAAARIDRGAALSDLDHGIVKRSLAAMLAHPFISAHQPPAHSRHHIDISQIAVWAEIFAIRTLDLVDQHPLLISSFPSNLQSPDTRAALKCSLQDDICRSIEAFKRDPEMNKGIGGSFFHTSLTFTAISALRSDQRDPLTSLYLAKVYKDGAADDLWPYDTTRGFHVTETPRSSAGRGLAVNYCRFVSDPSTAHAQKAIAALEQFYMYSGSLQANVSREGTHAGPDLLAPYYWAPGLYHAGRLCSEISERPTLLRSEDSLRLRDITGKIVRSALASFDPRHAVITHPGEATFQQIGPTFSTGLTMAALRDLDHALRILTPAASASGQTQTHQPSGSAEGALTREGIPPN